MMLNVAMTSSTLISQRNPSIKFKKSVFFNKKSFSSAKKNKDSDVSTFLKGSSSFKNNLENYQKNYNNLIKKSFLERIYKVSQHVINNKDKIIMAADYEEPKIILPCIILFF